MISSKKWQAHKEYFKGSLVEYDGKAYVATENFISGEEFNTTFLSILSPNHFAVDENYLKKWENIDMKEWRPNTKYDKGDIIERNNCVFLARVTFTSENEFNNENNFLWRCYNPSDLDYHVWYITNSEHPRGWFTVKEYTDGYTGSFIGNFYSNKKDAVEMAGKFNLMLQGRPVLELGDKIQLLDGKTGAVVGSETHDIHKNKYSFYREDFYKVLTTSGELRLISKLKVGKAVGDGHYVQGE